MGNNASLLGSAHHACIAHTHQWYALAHNFHTPLLPGNSQLEHLAELAETMMLAGRVEELDSKLLSRPRVQCIELPLYANGYESQNQFCDSS